MAWMGTGTELGNFCATFHNGAASDGHPSPWQYKHHLRMNTVIQINIFWNRGGGGGRARRAGEGCQW